MLLKDQKGLGPRLPRGRVVSESRRGPNPTSGEGRKGSRAGGGAGREAGSPVGLEEPRLHSNNAL